MLKNYTTFIRIMVCLVWLFLLAFNGQAQQRPPRQQKVNLNGAPIVGYGTGIGVRAGTQYGLTAKQFMADGNALELILSTHYKRKGITGTLLYEWHRDAFGARNLFWFYGGGGHVGYYQYKNYYDASNPDKNSRSGNFIEFGADGIIGLEYSLDSMPLSVGIDVKPYLSFISGFAGGFDGALSIRYIF